ncbi:MAG: hypothetical protein FJX64_09370 [Alphaproteobacteria bacterium]|nr:hypothetical protein [Alphaproteobacteria bacterium]
MTKPNTFRPGERVEFRVGSPWAGQIGTVVEQQGFAVTVHLDGTDEEENVTLDAAWIERVGA